MGKCGDLEKKRHLNKMYLVQVKKQRIKVFLVKLTFAYFYRTRNVFFI